MSATKPDDIERAGEIEVLGTFSDGQLKLRRWMRPQGVPMTNNERADKIVAEWKRHIPGDPEAPKLSDLIAAALSAARMEERAATVAWLRADAVLPRQLIAQLERGEHIASRSSRRKSLT